MAGDANGLSHAKGRLQIINGFHSTTPQECFEYATHAVEALGDARDWLIVAEASKRCIDKVRIALSSAKGAVRHAENRSYRKGKER